MPTNQQLFSLLWRIGACGLTDGCILDRLLTLQAQIKPSMTHRQLVEEALREILTAGDLGSHK